MTTLRGRFTAFATAASLTACGCAAWSGSGTLPLLDPVPAAASTRQSTPPPTAIRGGVITAGHRESASVASSTPPPSPLEGLSALTSEDVVRIVLERNPTLDQMRATAAAAATRYPQVTSLDDPNFAFSTAPGSIGSPNADYAARVEVSQKFLYPGKRSLKGAVVRAEASAAGADIDDTRLELTEAAVAALADYYLAAKAREVATESLELLKEFRKTAESRYKVGQGPQQDMFQADVEIGRLEERLLALRRAKLVAVARLNMLMHLLPENVLPPPADVRLGGHVPDAGELRARALAARPDLKAAAERVAAEEAALALALKEYSPDVELMAAYDGFWQGASGRPLQWQLGARVNLPVRYARRGGAVDEARAKVAQRRAELARLTDRVNFEVQEAFEQLRESEEVVHLYEEKVLKAADANVKEAQAGYAGTKIPFLNLIEAQRNRVMLKDRYFEALGETARRRAALERAVGGPIIPSER